MLPGFLKRMILADQFYQFSLFLLFILVFSMIDLIIFETNHNLQLDYITNYMVMAVSTSLLLAVNYYYIKKDIVRVPHIILSSIIIFLIVHPTTDWWLYPILVTVAFLTKLYIRSRGHHIFNPAAFAIACVFVLTVLFSWIGFMKMPLFVSWWGGELQKYIFQVSAITQLIPFFLLFFYIYIMWKYNKLYYSGIFIVMYSLLLAVGSISDVTRGTELFLLMYYLIFSSLTFMGFITITAPYTSPDIRQRQIVLGFFGGVLGYALTFHIPSLMKPLVGWSIPIPLILTILFLNLATHIVKKYNLLHPQRGIIKK